MADQDDARDRPIVLDDHTRTILYEGRRTIARHAGLLQTARGPIPIVREVYETGAAAAVLPYDPVRDTLVLLRQFRMTALVSGWNAELVELPAGGIEDGETPIAAAAREMKEELGLEATHLEPALEFLPSAGWMAQRGHLFIGQVDSTSLPQQAGLIEDSEITLPFAVPFATAIAALDAGRIHNGFAAIALHWFARHHTTIRARWGFAT